MHRTRALRAAVLISSLAVLACSGPEAPAHALQARGGTYGDGSGRLGLAVLAALRTPDGEGPAASWSGSVAGPGETLPLAFEYDAAGDGSCAVAWWPDVPALAGGWALTLAPDGGDPAAASFAIDDGQGLAPAAPAIAPDATAITWDAVPGAASYGCRVTDAGAVVLDVTVSSPACDLSGLPPGAYAASVLAYSADLPRLVASRAQRPSLPRRFDVSEARLAFARPAEAGAGLVLDAAGGAFHDGSSDARTLAVWLSIHSPAGDATAEAWTVEVSGPGIAADAPVTLVYPANFPRLLVWSYELPAAPGTYGVVARSGDAALATSFRVGAATTLDAPGGAAATAGAQGSADVTWTTVSGAKAYLVTAWRHRDGAFAASQWVAAPPAAFPAGTFTPDETYDVLVAATDADMTGGATPAQVAVTEGTYQPTRFVAR